MVVVPEPIRPHLVAQGLGGHTQGSGSSQSASASAFHPACSGPRVGVAPASRCVRRTCVTSVALWGPQNSEQFATFTDRSPKARFTHSQPLWGVGAPRQKLQNLFLPKVMAAFHEHAFPNLLFTFGWFLEP